MNNNNKNILVTGGAGFIGSHTVYLLLKEGYNVYIIDSLINSSIHSLYRISNILRKENNIEINNNNNNKLYNNLYFHQIDLCDIDQLNNYFIEIKNKLNNNNELFFACIHFAGLKAVGESTIKPLLYYYNNINGTINLLNLLKKYNNNNNNNNPIRLIFSSSATVYGNKAISPINENNEVGLGITNPYGQTKYMIENILKDLVIGTRLNNELNNWRIILLRYFNPVGAHPSGLIGEDPKGIPNNLMPFVAQVASGRREKVIVFGNDYDTPDGSGVRDYIHIMDLANGHLAALNRIENNDNDIDLCEIFNLGTGNGYSVLDMITAMSNACGHEIPYEIGPRREGDIATCYADPSKANELLNWSANLTLEDMCNDLWKWQSQNPNGYPNDDENENDDNNA